jgi:cytochrome P450
VRLAFLVYRVVIASPESLKRVLVTHVKNYPRADFAHRLLSPVLGNSVLLSEGDEHRRQRAYLSPAFHFVHHAGYQVSFAKSTKKLCDVLESLFQDDATCAARSLDMNEYLTKMTLDIIGITAFGFDFNALSPEDSEIVKHYHNVLSNAELSFSTVLRMFVPIYGLLPLPSHTKAKASIGAIRRKVEEIIEKKRKLPDDQQGDDLLSIMLQTSIDENGQKVSAKGVSSTELVDNVMTFMAAGHETTATTLTWALHLLSVHPDVQTRVQKEVDLVLKGELPTPEAMEKLPLIGATIDETLRLYPAAPITSRVAAEDDVLDGYKIPAGTVIEYTNTCLTSNIYFRLNFCSFS